MCPCIYIGCINGIRCDVSIGLHVRYPSIDMRCINRFACNVSIGLNAMYTSVYMQCFQSVYMHCVHQFACDSFIGLHAIYPSVYMQCINRFTCDVSMGFWISSILKYRLCLKQFLVRQYSYFKLSCRMCSTRDSCNLLKCSYVIDFAYINPMRCHTHTMGSNSTNSNNMAPNLSILVTILTENKSNNLVVFTNI